MDWGEDDRKNTVSSLFSALAKRALQVHYRMVLEVGVREERGERREER